MKVSIIGLGWLGTPLAKSLKARGFDIAGSTRTPEKVAELESFGLSVHLVNENSPVSSELTEADVIVLNIPPFENQLEWFKSWPWNKETHVIFISSTSVYGKVTGSVSEKSILQPDTPNAHLLIAEENWVKEFFPRWTILRMSGLTGGNRHPGRSMKGKTGLMGKNQKVNLIHQDDCVGFIETVIENDIIREVFNISSDEKRTREEMYGEFAEFDQNDQSVGKIILNEKMKHYYKLKVPTLP